MLTISNKIWLSLGILIVGYFGSMLFGYVKGVKTESMLVDVSDSIFPASQSSQAALTEFENQIKFYADAVIFGDEAKIDDAQTRAEDVRSSIEAIVKLQGINPEKRNKTEEVLKTFNEFTEKAKSLYGILSKGGADTDNQAGDLTNKKEFIQEQLSELTKGFSDELRTELASIGNATRNQRKVNMLVFFCVVFVAVGFVYLIVSRSISLPLRNTVSMLKDIAKGEGNLTKRLQVKSKDEVGELAKWFNIFIGKLQIIIKDISKNSEILQLSSTELSDLSRKMSKGANEMSGRANVVAVSSDEMRKNMDSVSVSMEQASGNTSMVAAATEEMTATINEIAQNSEQARQITSEAVEITQNSSERVARLGNSAKDIGEVTEAINDISEQTNLLALNATIEAARAGDAGKGFTVVANEIKELAGQTALSTKDIRKKIEDIQSSATGTVDDIKKISGVMHDISDIVATIATAVEEQSASTKEISGNIIIVSKNINDVSTKVATNSELSAKIAEEIGEVSISAEDMAKNSNHVNLSAEKLSSLAAMLKEMVDKFKV
ncbi:MAG: methyl-accepting chemotaxis protein [Desulfobacterales bacterium]|nr:methyl-accepting chemotaxis protein [Desulfobacterales bacterium]